MRTVPSPHNPPSQKKIAASWPPFDSSQLTSTPGRPAIAVAAAPVASCTPAAVLQINSSKLPSLTSLSQTNTRPSSHRSQSCFHQTLETYQIVKATSWRNKSVLTGTSDL